MYNDALATKQYQYVEIFEDSLTRALNSRADLRDKYDWYEEPETGFAIDNTYWVNAYFPFKTIKQ